MIIKMIKQIKIICSPMYCINSSEKLMDEQEVDIEVIDGWEFETNIIKSKDKLCKCTRFLNEGYVYMIEKLKSKGLLEEGYEMKCCICMAREKKQLKRDPDHVMIILGSDVLTL